MAYICLIYTATSRNLAELVQQRLEANGVRIWRREPELLYQDAESAAILAAAFRGAAAFVFVWSEQEVAPHHLINDYHAARKHDRPIYFVKRADQIVGLIAAVRQIMLEDDNFGPLPALAAERNLSSNDRNTTRSGLIVRSLSIGAALLGLITVIALFSLAGRDEFAAADVSLTADTPPLVTSTAVDPGGAPPSANETPSDEAVPGITALTASVTASATPSMTVTPSPTRTSSPTPTSTSTETPTATPTASPTQTPSPPQTATAASSPTPTPLLIPSATETISPTMAITTTPTATDIPFIFATNTPSLSIQITAESKSGR